MEPLRRLLKILQTLPIVGGIAHAIPLFLMTVRDVLRRPLSEVPDWAKSGDNTAVAALEILFAGCFVQYLLSLPLPSADAAAPTGAYLAHAAVTMAGFSLCIDLVFRMLGARPAAGASVRFWCLSIGLVLPASGLALYPFSLLFGLHAVGPLRVNLATIEATDYATFLYSPAMDWVLGAALYPAFGLFVAVHVLWIVWARRFFGRGWPVTLGAFVVGGVAAQLFNLLVVQPGWEVARPILAGLADLV
ncbi:hypothetical protein RGUI_2160 [Rhodovulum sp. P5]|uniref:hypothetical protein n=1 Tax=Rhodovulum sp. P5 TaxID=1564506 RepID=UPI0009C26F4B|nr:hypothetical protein [Rhodovulum sp. P5]ARE40301.1 hypothetical protein RGUI_2160 [Rhodovulum sp. P5]